MTFRQIAIVVVNPVIDIARLSAEELIAPLPPIIASVSMLTAAIDIPCRRAPPTLQSYHFGSVEEDSEGELGQFIATRLLRLSKVGPVSVVTYGGGAYDWPALRAVWLRHRITTCDFAFKPESHGCQIGERSREFIDLKAWISQGGTSCPLTSVNNAGSVVGEISRGIPAIYNALLRWLLIQGQMSKAVYDRAAERFPDEWRRLSTGRPQGPPAPNDTII
jgi:hypothetical protein